MYRSIIASDAEVKELSRILGHIILFPDNKEAYERKVGYKIEVINLSLGASNNAHLRYNMGLSNPFEDNDISFQRLIAEKGIEALINANCPCSEWESDTIYYGVPVRKLVDSK